jgi:hypothetical protein
MRFELKGSPEIKKKSKKKELLEQVRVDLRALLLKVEL